MLNDYIKKIYNNRIIIIYIISIEILFHILQSLFYIGMIEWLF